ncbi:hypothetical protein BH10PLA1_BH10PLA1_05400 [soil metagenome]
MMSNVPFILAEDDLPKGIVGLVIFAIWIISSVVSALKKKADQRPMSSNQPAAPTQNMLAAFQQEVAERLRRAQRPGPPAPPIMGGNPQINVRQKELVQLRQRSIAQAKKQKKRPGPPPLRITTPSAPVAVAETFSVPPPPALPPAGRATHVALPAVNAVVLGKWMKPATLRQQFIITEIFQPPLSMRE